MRGSLTTLAVLAVLLTSCGGAADPGAPTIAGPDPAAGGTTTADGVTLRGCVPPEDRTRTTLVAPDPAAIPPDDELEALLDDRSEPALSEDLAFMVDQLEQDGLSRSEALAEAWVQRTGGVVVEEPSTLPGFVEAAYGSLVRDEPFQLRFRGEAPPLDDYLDLPVVRAVGLDVVTGTTDPEILPAAYEAARELGIDPVGGAPRDDGTIAIEVVSPDADAVAAWEEQIDDPSICLVPAEPMFACDDDVVASARAEADADHPVLPVGPDDGVGSVPADRADQLRRSYLGLTEAEARAKAAEEGRPARVVVDQGVPLGWTDDLQPQRMNLVLCDGVVVDAMTDEHFTL